MQLEEGHWLDLVWKYVCGFVFDFNSLLGVCEPLLSDLRHESCRIGITLSAKFLFNVRRGAVCRLPGNHGEIEQAPICSMWAQNRFSGCSTISSRRFICICYRVIDGEGGSGAALQSTQPKKTWMLLCSQFRFFCGFTITQALGILYSTLSTVGYLEEHYALLLFGAKYLLGTSCL